jgi:hypothetical protein
LLFIFLLEFRDSQFFVLLLPFGVFFFLLLLLLFRFFVALHGRSNKHVEQWAPVKSAGLRRGDGNPFRRRMWGGRKRVLPRGRPATEMSFATPRKRRNLFLPQSSDDGNRFRRRRRNVSISRTWRNRFPSFVGKTGVPRTSAAKPVSVAPRETGRFLEWGVSKTSLILRAISLLLSWIVVA